MPRDPRELAGSWTANQRHEFLTPAPDLAPFVSRYWVVDWDYAEPYRQLIVPYPNVHLSFRNRNPPAVYGVSSGHVVNVLAGTGHVVGVAFRPGAFRPFLRSSVSALTDRTIPAADVPGLLPAPEHPVDAAAVEHWLRASLPDADPAAERATGAVEQVAADVGITRVDQLATVCGSSVRQLQRLFAEYVGVGPKWVIRRYRLHEVTERMARGDTADWAGLAAELGYADQAHLSRDFAAMFGEPPTYYARRY